MCRSIKCLAHFEPPANDEKIRASAMQFVRKLSGATRPSGANLVVFERAVHEVAATTSQLIRSLTSSAPPRNREDEARKARERSRQRFTRAAAGTLVEQPRGQQQQTQHAKVQKPAAGVASPEATE